MSGGSYRCFRDDFFHLFFDVYLLVLHRHRVNTALSCLRASLQLRSKLFEQDDAGIDL